MATYILMNPRKEGKFVTEQRCSCPTSKLYAIKFNKVKCKLMSQSTKNCVIFCYALFFFSLTFAPIAVVGVLRGFILTKFFIISALISCSFAIILTILFIFISEFTHNSLEVLYKCRSCGHQVHVTYEVLPEACSRLGGDNFSEFGHYTRTCQKPSTVRLLPRQRDLDETIDKTPPLSRSSNALQGCHANAIIE
uniref:Uncharacterized protein n=1 Tax=Globodera rostochiensis TaxID=31243 RepID=A0A914GZJ9_GLORO